MNTFLTSLKDRGLSNPSVIICDDFSGINNIIHTVYEDAKIQKCVIHKVRNAMTSVLAKYRKIFLKQLRKICCSDTIAEADFAFNSLKEMFGKQLPSAAMTIERSLEEILLLTIPIEFRRFIYINNISKNFNSALRKYVKKKAHSRTNELSMRLLMWRVYASQGNETIANCINIFPLIFYNSINKNEKKPKTGFAVLQTFWTTINNFNFY
ncbi:transposase [Ureaplasma ceti]|uniref:Mutator family transposase n=1 Tax=Ureaplasma ceti TaxID=3119530 RepID=A0ABP9U895_9BACT